MKMNSFGKNMLLRTDTQDQLSSTEPFLVLLKDLLLSLLNIQEVNGHSGFHQDKLLLFQYQRNSLSTVKEYKSIFINKVSKLSQIDLITLQQRKSENLNYSNGTISWSQERKNKNMEQQTSEAETKRRQLEARESMRLLSSSDHYYHRNQANTKIYTKKHGILVISQLFMMNNQQYKSNNNKSSNKCKLNQKHKRSSKKNKSKNDI